jgi:hypothetical protein
MDIITSGEEPMAVRHAPEGQKDVIDMHQRVLPEHALQDVLKRDREIRIAVDTALLERIAGVVHGDTAPCVFDYRVPASRAARAGCCSDGVAPPLGVGDD